MITRNSSLETMTPAPMVSTPTPRVHTIESDVIVPLLRHAILSFAVAVLAALVRIEWTWVAVIGVATFVIAWLASSWLSIAGRIVINRIERVTGLDVNRDGVIEQASSVTVNLAGPNRLHRFQMPGTSEQLQLFARSILAGETNAESKWKGKGKPLTDVYDAIRDTMIERGLASWNHPTERKQGWVFTRGGLILLRSLAGESHVAD